MSGDVRPDLAKYPAAEKVKEAVLRLHRAKKDRARLLEGLLHNTAEMADAEAAYAKACEELAECPP